MNNKFDELAKGMAQSVTRRAALKKFGVGLAAALAASLGIPSASAAPSRKGYCVVFPISLTASKYSGQCFDPATCQQGTARSCKGITSHPNTVITSCGGSNVWADTNKSCSF